MKENRNAFNTATKKKQELMEAYLQSPKKLTEK